MDDPFNPDSLPHVSGSETSRIAAKLGVRKAANDAMRVYLYVLQQWELACGATCDEIEVALNLPHQTASARVSELKRARWLTITGEVRNTRSNRPADVLYARRSGQKLCADKPETWKALAQWASTQLAEIHDQVAPWQPGDVGLDELDEVDDVVEPRTRILRVIHAIETRRLPEE